MSSSDRRRERAARLLAMALKAREAGQLEHAEELTQLAMDKTSLAVEGNPIPQPQQPQPDPDKDEE
jgi:hypothetical protein